MNGFQHPSNRYYILYKKWLLKYFLCSSVDRVSIRNLTHNELGLLLACCKCLLMTLARKKKHNKNVNTNILRGRLVSVKSCPTLAAPKWTIENNKTKKDCILYELPTDVSAQRLLIFY